MQRFAISLRSVKLPRQVNVAVNSRRSISSLLWRSTQSVPDNLVDASHPKDPRAMVITEAKNPFRIVSVNYSWEELCGYSQDECRGKTLACIQGEHTNKEAVLALVKKVSIHGEESCTVLRNYSKTGREFQNRLRIGPVKDRFGKVTHFVGVLEEVNMMVDRSFDDRYSMHSDIVSVV